MAANITYHEQTDMDNIRKLREVLKTLPAFAKDYFRAIEPTTSTKTRISYAYDIRIFFQFLISQNPSLAKIGIPNLNVSVLDQLKPIDIEEYMEYLKLYDSPNDQMTITNGERGLKRKISFDLSVFLLQNIFIIIIYFYVFIYFLMLTTLHTAVISKHIIFTERRIPCGC